MPKAKPFEEMIKEFNIQVKEEYTYISGYENYV